MTDDACKVNSLTGLHTASPVSGRMVWDPVHSIWNMGMIGTAIIFAPFTFTLSAFLLFLATTALTLCVGHSVGVHRRLIHRSFDCPKWLERLMVWLGMMVGIGGTFWTIRLHDTRDWGQREEDCHPLLAHKYPMWKDGLLYLNTRLELDRPPCFDPGAEIAGDPWYRFFERTWLAQQLVLAGLFYLLGGWPFVIWGVCVRCAACILMHWWIAHYAHTQGPQHWLVDDAAVQAHDVPLMAIPTFGEAWHNNHHAFPGSARHGIEPGQVDLGWEFIRLLKAVGLAWNIRTPETMGQRQRVRRVSESQPSVAGGSTGLPVSNSIRK